MDLGRFKCLFTDSEIIDPRPYPKNTLLIRYIAKLSLKLYSLFIIFEIKLLLYTTIMSVEAIVPAHMMVMILDLVRPTC